MFYKGMIAYLLCGVKMARATINSVFGEKIWMVIKAGNRL